MRRSSTGVPLQVDPTKSPFRLYDGIEYKEFWNEASKTRLDELEKKIICKLLPTSGYRIIDIGCGFGRLSSCYLNRFEQVVMLDGSIELLRQAQVTVGERGIYIAADANHMPFRPSSFDCAVMIRVFHHMQDSQMILTELQRVIGNGGSLVFNYSNKLSARQLILWMFHPTRENLLSMKPRGLGTELISHHPAYIQQLLKQKEFKLTKSLGAGIFDKLPDPSGRLISLAEAFAPIFGTIKLAPWINCQAVVSSGGALEIGKNLDDLLLCPACHGELIHQSNACTCTGCERSFPIDDGILDFRIG
jgi:ubiquinone/menaquinone biosynthesis C-methylase UbiE